MRAADDPEDGGPEQLGGLAEGKLARLGHPAGDSARAEHRRGLLGPADAGREPCRAATQSRSEREK